MGHMPHIAANVRAEAARTGTPTRDLADALNISRQALARRLQGGVDFRISELQAIAELLRVPISALLADDVDAEVSA